MLTRGLFIGINYKGTEFRLNGCINDAHDWKDLYTAHDGAEEGAKVLVEHDATGVNILRAMRDLVGSLAAGETGLITYSGHGTWVPDQDGDEIDGRDEAICPIDMGDDGKNLILDDQISQVFDGLIPGAKLVFVTDSCHSGTVFRFTLPPGGDEEDELSRVRFIPPSHFLRSAVLVSKMERAFSGNPGPARRNAARPGVIHFSGCGDREYSTDAYIGRRPCGAFSHYATRAFRAALKHRYSYSNAHKLIRANLPSQSFQQTPKLNASADLKSTIIFA